MTDSLSNTFPFAGQRDVHRIGMGVMRLTGQPGNFGPYPDWDQGISLLKTAVDRGVQFFDSAFAYGPQWADRLLGDALSPFHPDLLIATKGGVDKPEAGKPVIDGSPEALLKQVDTALTNLKTDCIDLFQLHRVDPQIPIEVSLGALEQARLAGKIRWIGLSNVNRQQLDRGRQVTSIASVQNRYNPAEIDDDAMVDYTQSLGIAYLPWGPLGADPFQKGATLPPRESLAWLLKRSPNIIVIPGTTSRDHLIENLNLWNSIP
ncbi:aldo/keto reductase [Mariniblastus sp.]|jgi:pyridoxine 4-dehydrogenase|nr:aldo/keto reductase [Mariniblastus sp.]MDB4756646.1 aldo/keto reductase [Mariniblastus sp.]